MNSRRRKPQWWQLYVGLPLLCTLFVFEIQLHLGQTADVILQLGILALIFMFTRTWLRANQGALLEMDEEATERQGKWSLRVYEVGPATARKSTAAAQPLVRLPNNELKGMLDTTFEMDADEPDSLFHRRAEASRPQDVLPLDQLRSPAHKE